MCTHVCLLTLLVFRQHIHTYIYITLYSQTLVNIERKGWTSIWKQPVLYSHELNRYICVDIYK
jgi:hypothetical protein